MEDQANRQEALARAHRATGRSWVAQASSFRNPTDQRANGQEPTRGTNGFAPCAPLSDLLGRPIQLLWNGAVDKSKALWSASVLRLWAWPRRAYHRRSYHASPRLTIRPAAMLGGAAGRRRPTRAPSVPPTRRDCARLGGVCSRAAARNHESSRVAVERPPRARRRLDEPSFDDRLDAPNWSRSSRRSGTKPASESCRGPPGPRLSDAAHQTVQVRPKFVQIQAEDAAPLRCQIWGASNGECALRSHGTAEDRNESLGPSSEGTIWGQLVGAIKRSIAESPQSGPKSRERLGGTFAPRALRASDLDMPVAQPAPALEAKSRCRGSRAACGHRCLVRGRALSSAFGALSAAFRATRFRGGHRTSSRPRATPRPRPRSELSPRWVTHPVASRARHDISAPSPDPSKESSAPRPL